MRTLTDPIALAGTGELDITPPITPQMGQGWGVVITNQSSLWLQVTTPTGTEWLPGYQANLYGSGCDSCSLRIRWQPDPADPSGTGYALLSWSQEPTWYPVQAYPMVLRQPSAGAVIQTATLVLEKLVTVPDTILTVLDFSTFAVVEQTGAAFTPAANAININQRVWATAIVQAGFQNPNAGTYRRLDFFDNVTAAFSRDDALVSFPGGGGKTLPAAYIFPAGDFFIGQCQQDSGTDMDVDIQVTLSALVL